MFRTTLLGFSAIQSPVIVGVLQRLYSTSANGSPGRALLLLRFAVSAFLIRHALAMGPPLDLSRWQSGTSAIASLFVLVGLWTPFSAALTAVIEFWIAATTADYRSAHLFAAAVSCGLVGLGPGAWSIDARLFGRRRISVDN